MHILNAGLESVVRSAVFVTRELLTGHPRGSRDPSRACFAWTPACAGLTDVTC